MPNANQRISEYILDQRLGGGAFGEVWRAHHHVWTDQLVAIKIPTDSQYIRNLQTEGAAVHGLVHPNIVRAMGFDPNAETPYLVMEYVPGTSLRDKIKNRTLTVEQSVSIMKHILAGLAHAHENGLIHRDIKPENILIHQRSDKEGFDVPGVVKITDFGLGKVAKPSPNSIQYSTSLSGDAARNIAGTIDYMAPEARQGGAVDARADIYSCAVTFYEMLTGEKPAGLDAPSELNPKVPKYLDEVFRKAYSRLDKRYASANEFSTALSTKTAVSAPPPLPINAPPPLPPACPSCRKPTSPNDQFCMHCGTQLVAKVPRCPRCGGYPDPNDQFCIFCGHGLPVHQTT